MCKWRPARSGTAGSTARPAHSGTTALSCPAQPRSANRRRRRAHTAQPAAPVAGVLETFSRQRPDVAENAQVRARPSPPRARCRPCGRPHKPSATPASAGMLLSLTSTPILDDGFCKGQSAGLHSRVTPVSVRTRSLLPSRPSTSPLTHPACASFTQTRLPRVWCSISISASALPASKGACPARRRHGLTPCPRARASGSPPEACSWHGRLRYSRGALRSSQKACVRRCAAALSYKTSTVSTIRRAGPQSCPAIAAAAGAGKVSSPVPV